MLRGACELALSLFLGGVGVKAFLPISQTSLPVGGGVQQKVAFIAMPEDRATQEWDVDRYQSQHSFVWEYGSSLVETVKESVDAAEPSAEPLRILDVGCGSGELTQALAQTLKSSSCLVHGMDADSHMIETAQSQFPDITFFQQDVRSLKPQDGDALYDIVFSNAALHWVPPRDAERAVASIANSLRPGGQLIVEFGGKGNVQKIVEATRAAVRLVAGMDVEPFWYFPSISDFSSLLEKHGIEVTSAVLYDRPTPLEEGEEGLANWLRMFGSKFLESLRPDQVTSVLNEVDGSLRPSHLWNGGQWMADYRRIRVTGIKTAKGDLGSCGMD